MTRKGRLVFLGLSLITRPRRVSINRLVRLLTAAILVHGGIVLTSPTLIS